jgi:hypothetical protein
MKKIAIILSIIGLVSVLFATEMIIHKTDGTQEIFVISDIESITFQNGGGGYENWALTTNTYSETDDLEQAVLDEMGAGWRIADWNDLLAIGYDIQNWVVAIGMEVIEDNYIVTRDGNHFWSGNRHYFITRFDHDVPGYYLVHDDIDNGFICLGSWYGLDMPILCIFDQ